MRQYALRPCLGQYALSLCTMPPRVIPCDLWRQQRQRGQRALNNLHDSMNETDNQLIVYFAITI